MTLRLVARFGDACNVGGGDPATVRQKLEVLQRHCEAVGRDYGELTKSTSLNVYVLSPDDSPDQVAEMTASQGGRRSFFVAEPEAIRERVGQLREAGIDYLIVYLPRLAHDREQLRRFEEDVVPHFT